MQELISINVWLSGRSYRIRVPKDEEAAVRSRVKHADEKIAELRQHYAGRDDQDFIAMCLLMYATDSAVGSGEGGDIRDAVKDMIARIDKELSRD